MLQPPHSGGGGGAEVSHQCPLEHSHDATVHVVIAPATSHNNLTVVSCRFSVHSRLDDALRAQRAANTKRIVRVPTAAYAHRSINNIRCRSVYAVDINTAELRRVLYLYRERTLIRC